MIPKGWMILLAAGALLLFVLLGIANLHFGDLNQDEGWYLYAAGEVAHGRLPYRDFAFTQGPVLPLVYAVAQPLVDRFGVAGGRFFTLLLGLAGAVVATRLAGRSGPRAWSGCTALLAFVLIAGSVYQSYFTTVVKTYALCGLLLSAGLLLLSFASSRGAFAWCFLSGILLALSAGTRISAGIAMPVAFLYLLLRRRDVRRGCWFAFGAGGALGLAGVFLPFFFAAPEAFLFGMLRYHSLRSAGGLLSLLVYKAGFISRFVQAYFVPVSFGILLVLLDGFRPAPAASSAPVSLAPRGFNAMLWAVFAAVTAVHLSANFPYDDYQVLVYPVFAVALAAAVANRLFMLEAPGAHGSCSRWMMWAIAAAFVVSAAASFSSPINQNWFVLGQDRIWWRLKDQPALAKLQEAGRWLRERTDEGDLLLTQDTYLAVEARRRVPSGLEMGPFSYFPEFSREQAERQHLLNREMLREMLRSTDAPYAAFSGYGLAIECPQVQPIPDAEREELIGLVRGRYEPERAISPFGQAHTTLMIFKRKADAVAP